MQSIDAGSMSVGLARIRARFIDELRIRRARLAELRSHLADSFQCHEALIEIGQISHKIAGTAKTLGFPELGASAAMIDDAIDQRATSSATVLPALLNRIDRMILDMDLNHEIEH